MAGTALGDVMIADMFTVSAGPARAFLAPLPDIRDG
jgi:hypothetical protein